MRWFLSQFPTFELLIGWWRTQLTVGGKYGRCGADLVPTYNGNIPLYVLQAMLLALFVVTAVASAWLRPRLEIRIVAPDAIAGGSAFQMLHR